MAHVIVVGGGIIGLLTAREFSQVDNQVTLIESGQLAHESSWAGGGILSPLYPWRYPDSVNALAKWSQSAYPHLCRSLLRTTGIDPEFITNGMLVMAESEHTIATTWAHRHRLQLELISQNFSSNLEPALAQPSLSAIWMPNVAQVRPPRLTKALAADLDQRGVTIITNLAVRGLSLAQDRVGGILTEQGMLEADAVVICAGAWTAELLKPFMPAPDIRPVRGQMILFKAIPDAISRILLQENRYIIPRRDGHILFGSTLEETGFDQTTTEEARQELYALATERFPILKNYPLVKQWAGLRPGSPAGIPYITAHPNLKGLYINAGHFRNGVVLGPASARLMVDIVTGNPPILPAEPYAMNASRE
ncbi:MAG: glycine oxidase ThiO [Chromatiales bacterium]|jgi:glycine oxidase